MSKMNICGERVIRGIEDDKLVCTELNKKVKYKRFERKVKINKGGLRMGNGNWRLNL